MAKNYLDAIGLNRYTKALKNGNLKVGAAFSADTAISATTVPASGIVGVIDLSNLPEGALEKLVVVADQTAMLALTSGQVQNGDTVKVTSPSGLMYYVKDESKLGTLDAFEVYTAGAASSVPWAGVTDKPTEFTPADHSTDKVTSLGTYEKSGHTGNLATSDSLNVALAKLENRVASAQTTAEAAQTYAETQKDASYINSLGSGYEKAATASALETTDTLQEALGKLEKQIEDAQGDADAKKDATYISAITSAYTTTGVSGDIASNDTLLQALAKLEVKADSGLTAAESAKASNYVSALTGYEKAAGISAITTSDSLNLAIGKLEKKADDALAAISAHTNTTDNISVSGYTGPASAEAAIADNDGLNTALGKLELKANNAKASNNVSAMTGYSKTAGSDEEVEATDTLNVAVAKLQVQIDNITFISDSDIDAIVGGTYTGGDTHQ